MMSSTLRRVGVMAVVLVVGFGLVRAATLKFQETEKAIREGCQADLKKLGLTRDGARAKYPTPEISAVSSGCLRPGQTAEVVVTGKFAPGTRFVFENDNIEVVKEALVGGQYRATVKAPAGIGPQTASIVAYSPLTCVTARREHVVAITAKTEWTMDASNGWRVIARPANEPPCGDGANADLPYEMTFFRKGETTPFAKRSATLHFDVYDQIEPYNFRITEDNGVAGQQDYTALMQKMQDRTLTQAQRAQLMKDLQKIQEQMMASVTKMSDPAFAKKMEEERQSFGCSSISASVDDALAVKGRMSCGAKVGRLTLTGRVTLLGR